jgi:hypothetical protein
VLLKRCDQLPPDVLHELALSWAHDHLKPCRPDAELTRNFDNLLARERARREPVAWPTAGGPLADTTGKLGEAPPPDAPVDKFAAYIARGFGLPAGYSVHRVVRYGGRAGTGLAVFIKPPGKGELLRIHYEKESDCWNPNKLRSRAAADTRGLTRGGLVTSQKAANAMYEAMCSMAENFDAADQEGQTWEWIQQLERVAARTTGSVASYQSLKRLQDHDYSKRLVQDPPTDSMGRPVKVTPLLLAD